MISTFITISVLGILLVIACIVVTSLMNDSIGDASSEARCKSCNKLTDLDLHDDGHCQHCGQDLIISTHAPYKDS